MRDGRHALEGVPGRERRGKDLKARVSEENKGRMNKMEVGERDGGVMIEEERMKAVEDLTKG